MGLRGFAISFCAAALVLVGWTLLPVGAQAGLDPHPNSNRTQVDNAQQPRTEHEPAHGRDRAKRDGERLPEVSNSAGEPLDVNSPACEQNLATAAKQGLRLPDGWDLRCVGPGLDWEGNTHWGVTCPYQQCPEGAGPYVSISNPTYYVVAHELCHANFGNDELMADRCAAEHGASLETSPYS